MRAIIVSMVLIGLAGGCSADDGAAPATTAPATTAPAETVPAALKSAIITNTDQAIQPGVVSDVTLDDGTLILQTTLLDSSDEVRIAAEAACLAAQMSGWKDDIKVLAPNGDVLATDGSGMCNNN